MRLGCCSTGFRLCSGRRHGTQGPSNEGLRYRITVSSNNQILPVSFAHTTQSQYLCSVNALLRLSTLNPSPCRGIGSVNGSQEQGAGQSLCSRYPPYPTQQVAPKGFSQNCPQHFAQAGSHSTKPSGKGNKNPQKVAVLQRQKVSTQGTRILGSTSGLFGSAVFSQLTWASPHTCPE